MQNMQNMQNKMQKMHMFSTWSILEHNSDNIPNMQNQRIKLQHAKYTLPSLLIPPSPRASRKHAPSQAGPGAPEALADSEKWVRSIAAVGPLWYSSGTSCGASAKDQSWCQCGCLPVVHSCLTGRDGTGPAWDPARPLKSCKYQRFLSRSDSDEGSDLKPPDHWPLPGNLS